MSRRREERRQERETFGRRGTATRYQMRQKLVAFGDDFYIHNEAGEKVFNQYKLTPLSLWGVPDARVPERRDVPPPFDPQHDPLANWKTINQAMIANPPLKTSLCLSSGPMALRMN